MMRKLDHSWWQYETQRDSNDIEHWKPNVRNKHEIDLLGNETPEFLEILAK